MEQTVANQTVELLARIEAKFGSDAALLQRLRPIVLRILESGPDSKERRGFLRLVVETYARHTRMRRAIDEMKERMVSRVNEVYGRMLGILPPSRPLA
ncbi:MAG: hypothetical protein ACT4PV_13635 [Planctomycetaceae bacterium]